MNGNMEMTVVMGVLCFLIIGGCIAAAAVLIRTIIPDEEEDRG